jgi:hypothetical protein
MRRSVTELPPTDPANLPELTSPLELEWYTPNETCDVCPSQSYYMVVFDTGNLFFCNHHFKKNEALIFEKALDIVDESELLNPSNR